MRYGSVDSCTAISPRHASIDPMDLSIVVPTYNEAPNIAELVTRVASATSGIRAEVVFVDDSTDSTADEIRRVAAEAAIPVRLIHRDIPTGGLGGAVMVGFDAAASDICIVMDGDLDKGCTAHTQDGRERDRDGDVASLPPEVSGDQEEETGERAKEAQEQSSHTLRVFTSSVGGEQHRTGCCSEGRAQRKDHVSRCLAL